MDTRTLQGWVAAGALPPQHLEQALELAAARPDRMRTLRFLDRLLLIAAVLCACSAVVFFFAYNWDAMGRLHKLALAQVVLALPLLMLLKYPLQHWLAQSALFASSLLLGAWLALIGQTYQTGADAFELFLLWAVLLVPWAVLARSYAIGVLTVVLFNLAALLACRTFTQFPADLRFALMFGINLLFWLPVARLAWVGDSKIWQLGNVLLVAVLLVTSTGWSLFGTYEIGGQLLPWVGSLVWLAWMGLLWVLYAWRSFQRPVLVLWLLVVPVWCAGRLEGWLGHGDVALLLLLLAGVTLTVALGGYYWLKPKGAAHE